MTQTQLLLHIQDAIQRDEPLTPQMPLVSLEEWDSLAIVSLISLYDMHFGITITGNTLRECQSVQDLIALVEDRLD